MSGKGRIHRLTPLAEADMEAIWLYTFRQWSAEQAEKYHGEIMTAIEGLASGQIAGQQSGAGEGYWKHRIGMHVVYFRYSDEYLDVIRVLHGRMDAEVHLHREQ